MAKRFSRLKYALKTIQPPTGTSSANTPPAGSILANFQNFQSGAANINYSRDSDSKQISIQQISVNPFALPLDPENKAIVGISERVNTKTEIASIRTACNHTTVDYDSHKVLQGFTPAKAIVFVKDTDQSNNNETSQITGIPYNPIDGSSYTIPYGSDTSELQESVVRGNIQTAINLVVNTSVRFISEKY